MSDKNGMTIPSHVSARLTLHDDREDRTHEEFAAAVRGGLTSNPKTLPCRWIYDAEGSRIFEEICKLPEYYLTRAETEIISHRATTIAKRTGPEVCCVEFGSGAASKTRILMDSLFSAGRSVTYVPIDVSRDAILSCADELVSQFPELEIIGIVGDYECGIKWMREHRRARKLVLMLGSNIGNLEPDAAAALLRRISSASTALDSLLLGIDLRKDRKTLERAYDDSAGTTARFNRNLLSRINRELGGHFELGDFDHVAVYEETAGCVKSYLRSRKPCRVSIDALGISVTIAAGELIHTEDSFKYSLTEIDTLARRSRFRLVDHWVDSGSRFSLNAMIPVTPT